MTTFVSTDAKMPEHPVVPAAVVVAADAATPGPVEVPSEMSVQHLYEAGLATLDALHDRWMAGIAELSQAPNAPENAAA